MTTKPFAVSVKAIIRDEAGRVLLLKRKAASKGNPGRWDLPGGKIDPGEETECALRREVREETGLEVAVARVAGAAESESPARRIAYLVFEACVTGGMLCVGEEHDAAMWAPAHDLPGLDLVPHFRPLLLPPA
jgi:8-oxo-dGTP diphosphatase